MSGVSLGVVFFFEAMQAVTERFERGVTFRQTSRMIMIMMVKSLVGLPSSASSAAQVHDLDPLSANRRLSSINRTTNTNTFVYTSKHLGIVLLFLSTTLPCQNLEDFF